MDFKYQVAIMGPGPKSYRTALLRALNKAVSDLGLNPANALQIISSSAELEQRNSVVGVWLGEDAATSTDSDLSLMTALLSDGVTIIPVVDTTDSYGNKVPPELKPLNGVPRQPLPAVIAAILRSLGLSRNQRQAFITYKRSDSTGVAIQVFDGLSERGYHSFLDTASVDAGTDFQSVLWDRICDADVHLFIDTPNALKSSWICDELARVNSLGLGVVQIVWPRHRPTAGTEFSLLSRYQLEANDFEKGVVAKDGRILNRVMNEILDQVEQSRIESLGLRRIQVIGELKDQASSPG